MLSFLPFLLSLSLLAVAQAKTQSPDEFFREKATARVQIAEGYAIWDKSRIENDKSVAEKMLAPGFTCELMQRKLSRKEFIDLIPGGQPGIKLLRFESQILTLTKDGDDWVAVITEKLEAERTTPDGKSSKVFNLWVTKDGWHKSGDRWLITFSNGIGNEAWREKPPVPGW